MSISLKSGQDTDSISLKSGKISLDSAVMRSKKIPRSPLSLFSGNYNDKQDEQDEDAIVFFRLTSKMREDLESGKLEFPSACFFQVERQNNRVCSINRELLDTLTDILESYGCNYQED